MAFTNTITANLYQPFAGKYSDYSPPQVEHLQTSGSKATLGVAGIFATGTVVDQFFLTTVHVSLLAPTAGTLAKLYMGADQICEFPTLGAAAPAFYSLSFGPCGANGPTTLLNPTVSVVTSGGTATVMFYANGFRKV